MLPLIKIDCYYINVSKVRYVRDYTPPPQAVCKKSKTYINIGQHGIYLQIPASQVNQLINNHIKENS